MPMTVPDVSHFAITEALGSLAPPCQRHNATGRFRCSPCPCGATPRLLTHAHVPRSSTAAVPARSFCPCDVQSPVGRALAFPHVGRYKAGMVEDHTRDTGRQLQHLLREALALTRRLAQHVPDAEASLRPPAPSRWHVERYGGTRYYALYDGDDLLAVTVY